MQISLSNNIRKLGEWDERDHINIKLLNIFELMAVLQNVYVTVVNNHTLNSPKITFSEFCVINCLLETISNKLANKLFKSYIPNETLAAIAKKISLLTEWKPSGSAEPTANLPTFENNSNDNIFVYIEKNFFTNQLFTEITEYCNNLLVKRGHILEFPKIIGEIDYFYNVNCLKIYVHKLVSLTSALQEEVVPEDLYQLLCFHSIVFENISHNNSLEAKAILAHTTQVCGSCLTLIADYTEYSNARQYIKSKLINIIKYSKIVNSLKFISSDTINPVLDSWYRELKIFLYSHPGEQFYNSIKNIEITPRALQAEETIDFLHNSYRAGNLGVEPRLESSHTLEYAAGRGAVSPTNSLAKANSARSLITAERIDNLNQEDIVKSGEFGARSDGAKPIYNRRAGSNDVTNPSSIDYNIDNVTNMLGEEQEKA